MGSVFVPFSDIMDILSGNGGNEMDENIIMNIRLPRAEAAMLLGGALALSGYLLQTFFNNPIAGPFVLGISSGAKLFVSISMILFM
ncbi:MAG: iron chelate uptake ABC transporter family permease subunit, partial [Lachnospiraceae bacterium]|nr:iron chelate uptake ABC transporter family permease subunit [Lachnospiraceae bacterium]